MSGESSVPVTDGQSPPSNPSPSHNAKQAVVSQLERLSSACIHAFNDHDFEYDGDQDRREFREHIAPKFQARIENYPEQAMTFEELNELWRGFLLQEPDCRLDIRNISTDVNVNGTAVLYMELDVTGVKGVNLTRFMELKWKIMQGKWMYYSCITMGGSIPDGAPR